MGHALRGKTATSKYIRELNAMKRICGFVGTVGLLLAGQVVAAAESDSQRVFKSLDTNGDGQLAQEEIDAQRMALFTRLVRTADEDGDGKLSAEEFKRGLQPARIEKPLIEKASNELPGADALKLLLARMDTNRDQRLVRDEVPREYAGFFDRLEERAGGKKDGKIDLRELIQSAPKLCQLAQRYAKQQGIDVERELARLPKEQRFALERMDIPARPMEVLSDPKQVKELFARWDADGNGQVNAEEIPERLAKFFDGLLERNDENADGQLSKQELLALSKRLAAAKAAEPNPQEVEKEVARMLKRFDLNEDEQLSIEEAPRRMADRFQRVDANGDGLADREELRRVVKLLSRLRKSEKGLGK